MSEYLKNYANQLKSMRAMPAVIKNAPEMANPDLLQILPPLRIYELTEYTGGLETAKFSGYYYPLEASGKLLAACTVLVDDTGTPTRELGLNLDNPAFPPLAAGLKQLPEMSDIRSGSYEARLLRSRGLFLVAIWLKSENGGKDWIYVCDPGRTSVKRETSMTVDEFLKTLQQDMQKMMANQE